MKDYKRLSFLGYSLCDDCGGIGACKYDCPSEMRYKRLQNLEDKIERGEIDYVADKNSEIARLTAENAELRARLDRAVELPCEVGDTIYWICKACDAPCECKYYTCEYPEGAECHAPSLPYGYSSGVCFSDEIVDEECKKHLYVEERKFNLRFLNAKTGKLEPQYFIDREAAEARLKELQGGERLITHLNNAGIFLTDIRLSKEANL